MAIWEILKTIFLVLGWILSLIMCHICYQKDEIIAGLIIVLSHISDVTKKTKEENKGEDKNNENNSKCE